MLVGVRIVVALQHLDQHGESGFRAARNAAGSVNVAPIMRFALTLEAPTAVADRADFAKAAPKVLALWYALHPRPHRAEPTAHADGIMVWKRPAREDGPLAMRVHLSRRP